MTPSARHGDKGKIRRVEIVAVVRSHCANLRRLVKRILRKHGYPPDKQGGGHADGA